MSERQQVLRYFRENRDFFDTTIAEETAKNRTRAATLCVKAADGTPIPGADVRLVLKNHEFRFGCNLFMLDEFDAVEKNAVYRDKFAQIFNLATLPFYWSDQEPMPGMKRYAKNSPRRYRRPPADLCLEYCADHAIEPKAHCLNYDNFRPAWVRSMTIDEHKAALEARFAELADRFADRIPSWEVTNETFNIPFIRENLRPTYSDFYLEEDFVAWSFITAKKYFPNNRLIINDHTDFGCMRSLLGDYFGVRSPYFMQIKALTADPAIKLDSIGFQYHCFFDKENERQVAHARYNPLHLWDILETYARLGRRQQITEMTVSALGTSDEDEEIQSELVENLFRVFFAHKSSEAIVYWNLPDGYASGGRPGDLTAGENRYCGGLLRYDLSEKPAYRVLDRLIRREWHTNVSVVTDASGRASFRGYHGDYAAEIHAGGRTVTLPLTLASAENDELVLRLP